MVRLYRNLFISVFIWTIMVAISLSWNIWKERQQIYVLAKNEARAHFNKDQAFRLWGALHGGVYVPVSERTPPNPYLSHMPERDIQTPSGKDLTQMNPAYMIRQLMEEYANLYGIRGRITSLKPLNPINTPDEWEKEALGRFEDGEEEVFEFAQMDSATYLRLMRPMLTKSSCLKCHAVQGYEVGDIRGGVGVTVPMEPYQSIWRDAIFNLSLTHGLIFVLGLMAIGFVSLGSKKRIMASEQAQLAIKENEERLAMAIEASGVGVFEHAIPIGPEMYLSEQWASILGRTVSELPDYDRFLPWLVEQIHPDDRFILEEANRDFIQGITSRYDVEVRMKHASGKWIWVKGLSRATAWEKTGRVTHLVGVLLDITERKHTEKELITHREHLEDLVRERTDDLERARKDALDLMQEAKGEKQRAEQALEELAESEIKLIKAKNAAEAANRAKSVFLANMSHELRTPLNVVLGYSQLMRRDSTLTPYQREHLSSINQSGEHLLGLIDSVLEISKIEAGRTTLEPRVFDVRAFLQDLSSMFRRLTNTKDLTLDIAISDQVPRYVLADENKLRQVLINLVGNAIKFTESGGISLRATTSTETPYRLRIEVKDTGIGIPAADHQKIFEPFEQILGAKEVQNGTGLGLAICREYVGIMGGELTVRSDNGHGSTFTFEVNFEPVPAAAIDRLESSSGQVVGLTQDQPIPRILVAEDQEANRALFVNLLQSVGFDVRGVSNGREALDVWEDWAPHLIWMDVGMPEMDGLEATRRIKGTEKGRHTKIFALTAIAFEKDRDRILAAGCDDLVRKPYQESEIFEKMAEHLSIQYEFHKHERPEKTRQQSLEGLASQDTDWLKALEHAARVGDLDAILDLVGQVQQDYPELGQSLSSLAGEFQFDEILNAVEQHL